MGFYTLIADILTASTIGFLTGFAERAFQSDWPTAFLSVALAVCSGYATIYFRQQV